MKNLKMDRINFLQNTMGFKVVQLSESSEYIDEKKSREANGWFYATGGAAIGSVSAAVGTIFGFGSIYGPDVMPVGTYTFNSYYVYIPNSKIFSHLGKIEVYNTSESWYNNKLQWVETDFMTAY